ncbi:neutral zinc metallopeptidase [Cryptosporangium minutisporangium]|uniref:Metalloprotease n=1 Tax=Cryptosporangium minutisporangium TaxID=113569 RepID=A0ABP6T9P2_9ACTN
MRGMVGIGRRTMALAGAVALLAVAGCTASDQDPAAPSAPRTAASGVPANAASTASTASPNSEFDVEVEAAFRLVADYWDGKFSAGGHDFRPVAAVRPYTKDGELTCAGQAQPTQNAFYCPADDSIGYDVNWVRQSYQQIGDSFVYFLVAHEYGHAIQERVRANRLVSITYELQADCLSGAFVGDSVRSGVLELEDGDLDELTRGVRSLGDRAQGSDAIVTWLAPDAHGSMDQRLSAFARGYRGSIEQCHLDSANGMAL